MNMWRKIRGIGLAALVVVSALAFTKPAENYFEITKNLDIFVTLFKEINTYYVDEVDPSKLIREGIDAMLESLDPYTDFIAEDELENFRIATTGQYAGIGAMISLINEKVVITHPYKNFPAYKAGLQVGDEILTVNGQNVKGKPTSEVSMLLKGQPHTEVEVKVKRFGQKSDLIFKIKREKISINNISYTGIISSDIGYIKLDDFTPGAAKEVSSAVIKLKAEGAKKIILDLRDNPGGLLHEAVNIVSLFVPKGSEVVSTKGKVQDWNKTYKTLNNPIDLNTPLAILTSEGSASASEIVAGSLQDYDRAVLIGNKTFGKGLVQTTRQLSYNSQLKVTTAKYYIPSGRCIQRLDYSHRKLDGSAQQFADSLKSEFSTKNGRKVYDGGGLDPDILIDQSFKGEITAALYNSGLFFEYAIKYCAENAKPTDFKSFTLSDKEYERFEEWTKIQKFSYSTPLEIALKQVQETKKSDPYYFQIELEMNAFAKKIEESKKGDFKQFKAEIKQLLTRQISFNYALNEALAIVSMSSDNVITEAINVLGNPAVYKKILSP
jgi:carboxyl-terminal processing protease